MNDPYDRPPNCRTALCVGLLVLLNLGVFAYTVRIRRPWFDRPAVRAYEWATASTIIFTTNWRREGLGATRLAMYQHPASIEFQTIADRDRYVSYSPAAFLPIYALSVLRGHEPTLGLVMKYNLLNHLLLAVVLSLTVFVFLRQNNFARSAAMLLSLPAAAVILLMPMPLYHFQNDYFTDHAVLLPMALFILLEVARGSVGRGRGGRVLAGLQAVLLFVGTLVDWLFVPLALVAFTQRLVRGHLGRRMGPVLWASIRFWLPTALALGAFLWYLGDQGALTHLAAKALHRAGLDAGAAATVQHFNARFWGQHVAEGFGDAAVPLLWGSLLLWVGAGLYGGIQRLRGRTLDPLLGRTAALMGLLLVPCFLYVYALRNHSYEHEWSALKFALPLGTVPFALAPVLLACILRRDLTQPALRGLYLSARARREELCLPLVPAALALTALGYTLFEHARYAEAFPPRDQAAQNVGAFLSANTTYRDIVFSPQVRIDKFPPMRLALSRKRVYPADSILTLHQRVGHLDLDYQINLLVLGAYEAPAHSGLGELMAAAHATLREGEMTLHQIRKADFLRCCQELLPRMPQRITRAIAQTDDPFQLHDLAAVAELVGPDVAQVARRKLEEACSATPGQPVVPEQLTFLRCRWQRTWPGSWQVSLLFRASAPIERDWHLYLHARVREQDIDRLPIARRAAGYDLWCISPGTPTSSWPPHQATVVTAEITASPIPYHLTLGFWRFGAGRYGQPIELGWTDLSDPPPPRGLPWP